MSFDQFRGSACLRGVEVACLCGLELVESTSLLSTLIVKVQILSEVVIKISF